MLRKILRTTLKENIGLSILKALKKRKMSQRQLALNINKPATQLNKWILGKNEIGIYVILDIAEALNISIDELIGRKFEPSMYPIIEEPISEFKKQADKEILAIKDDVDILRKEFLELKKLILEQLEQKK